MDARAEAPPPNATHPRGRRSRFTWIALAAAAALVGGIALVPSLRTVDLTPLRAPLAALVRSRTGRVLALARGPLLRLSVSPALIAEDVTVANAPWGSQPIMLRAKRVEVAVRVLPLFLGRLIVDRVVLTAPDLLLETDGRGHVNWTLAPGSGGAPTTARRGSRSALSHLRLRYARVTDAVIRYRDGETGRETRLSAPAITLVPGTEGGGGMNLRAALDLNGTPVTVVGHVGGPAATTETRPLPFHLTGTTAGATATFAGSVNRLLELEGVQGKVSLEISDPRGLSALLGVDLPRLSPFRCGADVRDTGGGLVVEPLRVEIGHTELTGRLTSTTGTRRPMIAAELSGPRVDLAELLGGTSTPPARETSPAGAAPRLFSAAPLQLDWLNAVDATVELHAETLVLDAAASATGAAAHGTIAGGELTVDPVSMTLDGGRLTGRLRLAAGRPPTLSIGLDGRRVALTALLGALGVHLPCRGCDTDLTADLHGTGASVHEWMTNLDGTLRVEVAKGRLETGAPNLGSDVLTQVIDAINPFHRSEPEMELRCGVVNVAMDRGVVRLGKGVAAETSKLNLVASGTADFGKEALDIEVRSRATKGLGLGLGIFAGAVQVRGPLAHPSLGLNPVGVAESTVTTVGAAAATGGLSLVAKGIWDRLFAGSPCTSARRRHPEAPAGPSGPQKRP